MSGDDLIRIQHMYDAASEAIEFTKKRTIENLDTERIFLLALLKDVEIIGEAASKISNQTRLEYTEIPWTNDYRN
ncbi:MAG: HepT-like ribonuclease domain-containing protein [Bacteroidota bacterium]